MMKRIMTSRVAALALAAIPLTTAPALADAPARTQTALSGVSLSLGDASFYVSIGNDRWRGRNGRQYRRGQYGQSPWEVRQLRQDAMQRCAGAIQRQGYRAGFRDVDIDDDLRVRQTGYRDFVIRFDDVEFEGRRRDRESDVTCVVRDYTVVSLSGLPQAGRGGWDRGHHDRWDRNDRDDRYDRRGGPGGQRLYGGRPGS